MACETCRYCGSANLFEVQCEPPTPHWGRLGCRDCHRFLGWLPAPMTDERAREFVMPFGKHGGETLGQIASATEGRRYLRWCLDNLDLKATLRRAVEHILTLDSEAA